ncbi:MAG: hypothetical protein WC417_00955 [Candidatus Omnitrophota bacterium]|jgi:hypothetical protein
MKRLIQNGNYLIFFILIVVTAAGCVKKPDASQIVAEVNNYQVTIDDFRQEAAMSMSAASKEQILQNIINKELLLEEAQKMNLDKNKNFMKEIENYWKQALIERLITIKGNDFLAASKGDSKAKMENAQALLESWITGLKNNASIKKHDDVFNGIKLKKANNQDGGTNAESNTCTP